MTEAADNAELLDPLHFVSFAAPFWGQRVQFSLTLFFFP
jgi:hypothetical protein